MIFYFGQDFRLGFLANIHCTSSKTPGIQVRQGEPRVLALAAISQMLIDQIANAKPLTQLTNQSQTAVQVTRDPWKSTFKEALFCFSPIGC
jgi:hypothetical protein